MYGLKIHVKKFNFYNLKIFQIPKCFSFISKDHLRQELLLLHFLRLVLNVMSQKEKRNVKTKMYNSFYFPFKLQIFQ